MALSRAVVRYSLCLVKDGFRKQAVGILRQRGPLHRPPVLACTPVRWLTYRPSESTLDTLRIWKLLRWLGLDYCKIVRFRRRMKKYTYPWLAYSVPTALILAIGDMIAQYHLKPQAPDRTIGQFLTKNWVKGETVLFGLMGFFLVGPILSKWNLFIYRKLRCQQSFGFLIRKLALDLFILSPILLTLMAAIYGANYGYPIYNKTDQKEKLQQSYFSAIKEPMIFNMITRPLAVFGICFLAPVHLRRLLKSVYEIIFAAYVTDALRRNLCADPSSPRNLKDTKTCKSSQIISPETLKNSRWARYKKWACRNKE